jgi:hypothetical protein
MRSFRLFLVPPLFLALSSIATPLSAQYPTSTEHQRDIDKAALYTQYYEAKKIATPEQQYRAYELAQQYLKQFGNDGDSYAQAVRKFIAGYEKALREFELNKAYSAKNYLKVVEAGNAMLAKDPDDYFVLAMIVQAGYEMSRTDASRNKQTVEHARHALQLIDTGSVPKAEPFKDNDSAKGFLNFVIGWLLRTDAPAEAAAALRKSIAANSAFKIDPAVYSLLGIMIIKGEFDPKAAQYNETFGNKQPSPEQQAALSQLNQIGARAIDAYARAVALSTKPEQQEAKAKLMTQLTALYKSFNNDSDAGLNELIASVLTKPLP